MDRHLKLALIGSAIAALAFILGLRLGQVGLVWAGKDREEFKHIDKDTQFYWKDKKSECELTPTVSVSITPTPSPRPTNIPQGPPQTGHGKTP